MACGVGACDGNGIRVLKGCLAADAFDLVECEVLQNAPALHVDDFTLVVHEIVDGKIFLERIVDSVETALLEAGKVERGFAEGLAGNGAGIDTTSAHMLGALDDGNAFAEIGGLGAAFFTSRAAADHDQIETVARSHEFLRRVLTCGPAFRIPEDCRGRGQKARKFLAGACWIVPFAETDPFEARGKRGNPTPTRVFFAKSAEPFENKSVRSSRRAKKCKRVQKSAEEYENKGRRCCGDWQVATSKWGVPEWKELVHTPVVFVRAASKGLAGY